jgi:hypothetical protein
MMLTYLASLKEESPTIAMDFELLSGLYGGADSL